MVSVDLLDTLKEAWQCFACAYEITAELPDMAALFSEVDLVVSARAAEMVAANMLTEVMEHVGRFSPWYRKPASMFGLTLVQDARTHCHQWRLTPGAALRWQTLLRRLAVAVEQNKGLILSARVLESLADDDCVMARCICTPPRVIVVSRTVLGGAQIRCDACQEIFELVEDEAYWD